MPGSAATGRLWLDVPFDEKDEAKQLGARWDPAARRWYAARPNLPGLDRWAALPPVPNVLPGEDRRFGSGLFVDLVPNSCWFTNVRSCVSSRDWERIRRMVAARAVLSCEACGQPEDRYRRPRPRRLDVHERWEYDQQRLVQALRRLICLCSDCHRTTHYGYAQTQGDEAWVFAHLRAVSGMSDDQACSHVEAAFQLWEQRNQHVWTLDLSMLTEIGVTVQPPPDAERRARVAGEQTAAARQRDDLVAGFTPEELVRMMRAQGIPVDDAVGPVRIGRIGGDQVWVDPQEV